MRKLTHAADAGSADPNVKHARRVANAWNRLHCADSYTRLNYVMRMLQCLPRLEWFSVLGREWSRCDNIWRWTSELRLILNSASTAELAAMMNEHEASVLSSMPPKLTIFRGCYERNRNGLSWSLSHETATKFPFYVRYRGPGNPLLLTGEIDRSRAVLKLDRDEHEVIAAGDIVVTTAVPLPSKEEL